MQQKCGRSYSSSSVPAITDRVFKTKNEIECCHLCLILDPCYSFIWNGFSHKCHIRSSSLDGIFTDQTVQTVGYVVGQYSEELDVQCAGSGYEWYPDDNFCFQLYTTTLMSQSEAMADCLSKGQRLVRVDTTRKHKLLVEGIQQLSMAFNGFWIDGSDEITKNNWLFVDGTPITEFHWGAGEPAAIGKEDCLIMGSIVDYDWNNLACSQMREYICEIV
ncbi:type-2 ice-structuring protein-like [Mytilus trossulus]|uniref:type-2 ice-structuring protein-like n=1 Tax=Mytilus trossulus TaxID=6551 RepID=UPI00300464F8